MLVLNTVITFQDVDTEKWVFDDKKELISFSGSQTRKNEDGFVRFGCYED